MRSIEDADGRGKPATSAIAYCGEYIHGPLETTRSMPSRRDSCNQIRCVAYTREAQE